MMKRILFVGLVVGSWAGATTSVSANVKAECARFNKAVATGNPTQRLKRFIDTQWDYNMHTYPEWATYVGYPGQDDRWTDSSMTAIAERKQIEECQLKAVQKIPRKGLKGEDVINFDLMSRRLQDVVEGNRFDGDYLALDQMSGLQMDVADMMDNMPKTSKKNYEDRIARLEKVPQLEQQIEALLREGLKRKVTAIKMLLEKVPTQFDRVLTAKAEDSPLYRSFVEINAPMNAAEKADIQKRALAAVKDKVYPALQKLRSFVVADYIPNSRTTTAWKDLPNGEAWYAFLVKEQTTTSMTPEELHQLGVKEVARIAGEMEKIRSEVKFNGDLQAFNKFLMTDKQFYFTDPEALLAAHRDIAKRIDPELPRLFGTLPRLPYGVRAMPEYKAKEAPAAYYESGNLETGRPGYFTANTYDLKSSPKWAMEALTMHEAVPGHHLQISIAQELKNLPEFRKHGGYTAYVEGWGLYAESLGSEMGFYKDPYSKYGALTYEMLRACRLVLDTGMHMKGWTREQSVKYFLDHNAMSRHEAETEVDRYLTWPAQALAYKVGQLKFRRLRDVATAELGDKFDVRKFHDEVLRHGALPMDVLEKTVMDWIALQKKTPATPTKTL